MLPGLVFCLIFAVGLVALCGGFTSTDRFPEVTTCERSGMQAVIRHDPKGQVVITCTVPQAAK
jgi:hypothetical protein